MISDLLQVLLVLSGLVWFTLVALATIGGGASAWWWLSDVPAIGLSLWMALTLLLRHGYDDTQGGMGWPD